MFRTLISSFSLRKHLLFMASSSSFSTTSSNIQEPLIIVAGCTGTGKSDLGVALAERFNGEIISADSMQIYKGLDIVTNKITDEEARGIPHHLMSFLDPDGNYSVHAFQRDTLRLIGEIRARQRLPIIVGGTAYYPESVMYKDALIEFESSDAESERVRSVLRKKTAAELYKQLKELDPDGAKLVHPNNHFRVLRALEVCLLSGSKKSELNAAQRLLRFPNTLLFILDANLEVLDERLDKRVIKMEERGLLTELDDYYKQHKDYFGTHGVKQSIGIKEFCSFLDLDEEQRAAPEGRLILRRCYDDLKLHTRQYSRSQRQWARSRFGRRGKLREVPQSLTLDTSRDFFTTVVPFALDRAQEFLTLGSFLTADSPCVIKNQHVHIEDQDYVIKANTLFHCDVCSRDIHSEQGYHKHLIGRKHRKRVAKQQKAGKRKEVELVNETESVEDSQKESR